MSTAPSNDPNAKNVPPDPGGRSRYLVRGIAITCVVLAVVAVILLFILHSAAPSANPNQQQQNNGGSRSSLAFPALPHAHVPTDAPAARA